jgi:hypothetical protein
MTPVGEGRPAAASRPARGLAVTLAMLLAGVLACGCAAIPASGRPQEAAAAAPQGDGVPQCCRVLVQPPQVGWSPTEVVHNFLLASSIFADNYRIARTYLTTQASARWHPGPEVTILSGPPQVNSNQHVNSPPGNPQVEVTGTELATLTSSGQYIRAANGQAAPPEVFGLQDDDGVYRISSLPTSGTGLLLTSDLFHLVYTPRNLYYFGNGKLLPDPVFVPIQSAGLVSTLVNDLRRNPAGWLAGAARTYLPARAHLAGQPQVFPGGPSGGRTAIVNIAVPRGTRVNIPDMVAQLVYTLTSPVFSPPLFRAVRVKINGRLWPARGPAQTVASYQGLIPHWRSGLDVYYLTPDGGIRTLSAGTTHGATLPKGATTGAPLLNQVAVSPDGTHLAGIAASGGTVYWGGLSGSGRSGGRSSAGLSRTLLSGSFSALSWDSANDLWVVRRGRHSKMFVLPSAEDAPLQVHLTSHLPGTVTGLRVAPDGVRVAMIIGSGATAQVWLAAARRGPAGFSITRPIPLGGQSATRVLTGVRALTWYDEDHLLVVTGDGSASQLWEVPVDGDSPTSEGKDSGITSVTAAGPGNPIYLGLSDRRLVRVVGLLQLLQPITAGQAPVYPG